MFNFNNGRYRLRTLLEGKVEILRFQQGRLSTFDYFEKYLKKSMAMNEEEVHSGKKKAF